MTTKTTVTKERAELFASHPMAATNDETRELARLASLHLSGALPQGVLEALQCAADYGPMDIHDWIAKWRVDPDILCHQVISEKCAAALAAHPETAPVQDLPKRESSIEWAEPTNGVSPQFEGDPKECAFKPHPEPISDEHHKANESVRELRADVDRLTSAVATWKSRAEWLLAELRGGAS